MCLKDETQVVKIETGKYFRYLIDLVTSAGGNIELGTNFTAEDIKDLQKAGHVVNCLGNAAGSIGGAKGEYYSNPGEVVIWKDCPRDFGFYVMDDDKDAGVMQMPDGSLYLSIAEVAGPDQTKTTIWNCDGVCRALFGAALTMEEGGVGLESWKKGREGSILELPRGPMGLYLLTTLDMAGLVWRLLGLVLLELWMPWLVICLGMVGGRGKK